jgi:hypothetical protein
MQLLKKMLLVVLAWLVSFIATGTILLATTTWILDADTTEMEMAYFVVTVFSSAVFLSVGSALLALLDVRKWLGAIIVGALQTFVLVSLSFGDYAFEASTPEVMGGLVVLVAFCAIAFASTFIFTRSLDKMTGVG